MTRPRVRKMISVPKRKRREPDVVYLVSPAGAYPVVSRFSYTDPDTGEVYAGTMVDEVDDLSPELNARLAAYRKRSSIGPTDEAVRLLEDIEAERAARNAP